MKRIEDAYINGGLRSHTIFPVFIHIAYKTGYADDKGQFVRFTVRELAQRLNASKTNVSEALQELINLGIIYKSKYGYAFIENMAHKGNSLHQAKLAAMRKRIQEEENEETY
jgi:CTP-dependent riboflavin kinase